MAAPFPAELTCHVRQHTQCLRRADRSARPRPSCTTIPQYCPTAAGPRSSPHPSLSEVGLTDDACLELISSVLAARPQRSNGLALRAPFDFFRPRRSVHAGDPLSCGWCFAVNDNRALYVRLTDSSRDSCLCTGFESSASLVLLDRHLIPLREKPPSSSAPPCGGVRAYPERRHLRLRSRNAVPVR